MSEDSVSGPVACGFLIYRGRPICEFLLMKHADRWDLPNVDPLFDRLSIETYPHVSALVDHWEAHCPERTLRNTLCVCTLGVFVRLTYLLPLFCDDFDDGSGPRNHLALLHGVHEHLETGGALYTLLQGWEAAQPLPREAKKSEREALRRLVTEGLP